MPTLRVTTKSANKLWTSPDGKIEMFELEMEWEGKTIQAKTYSKAIAAPGWSGEVESYDKDNKGTMETFVKQPPKEDGSYGGQGGMGGRNSGGRPMADPFTMYLSYAKDIVVAHIAAQTKDGIGLSLDDSIAATLMYGSQLFDGRPGADTAKVTLPEPQTTITTSPLGQVFNSGEPIPEEDDPWHPKTN